MPSWNPLNANDPSFIIFNFLWETYYIFFLEIFIQIRESIKEWLILFPGKKISHFSIWIAVVVLLSNALVYERGKNAHSLHKPHYQHCNFIMMSAYTLVTWTEKKIIYSLSFSICVMWISVFFPPKYLYSLNKKWLRFLTKFINIFILWIWLSITILYS